MIALTLTALFLLILAQVFLLFRVANFVRRRLRPLIPERSGVARESIAALLFLCMVALVYGVYLFGPAYVVMQVFALVLSIPPAELGKFVPVFLFISILMLGVCVKSWPRHFAFCGLTTGSTSTHRDRRAG